MRYVFPRFPDGKTKAVTFSYDDGLKADIRLARVLDSFGMKGSFNIYTAVLDSGMSNQLTSDEIKQHILAKGHEVAIHGHNHTGSGASHPITCIKEVLTSRERLEQTFETIIRGMAYPDTGITYFSNGNNYETVTSTLKALGVVYARTLRGDNNGFRLPEDWYAWMPTAHHNNPQLLSWVDEFVNLNVKALYPSMRFPRLLKIWGHSTEFDKNDNWDRLEDICSRLADKPDIWYATSIEIYEYMQAYGSLVFSADGKRIYNPTLKTVWFDVDGKLYSVESGKTIILQ